MSDTDADFSTVEDALYDVWLGEPEATAAVKLAAKEALDRIRHVVVGNKCPTCGSPDPAKRGTVNWYYDDVEVEASVRAEAPCPDTFHSGEPR